MAQGKCYNREELIAKLQQCRHSKVLIEFHTARSVLGWKSIESVSDRTSGEVVISVDLCDFSAEQDVLASGHIVR
jgi:hypothetical protein